MLRFFQCPSRKEGPKFEKVGGDGDGEPGDELRNNADDERGSLVSVRN